MWTVPAEALADSLHKLSKPGTATVKVIHKAVGQITESDVSAGRSIKSSYNWI